MRVVLISLYDVDFAIGVKSVYAYLKANGCDVRLIQFGITEFVDTRHAQFLDLQFPGHIPAVHHREVAELKQLLRELEPDLIGFGFMSALYSIAKRLTREVRKVSRAPIIWGGIHPTIDPEKCIRDADLVCRGEGEAPMLDLVRRIEAREDFKDIPNLWVRRGRSVTRNDPRPPQQNLDALPVCRIDAADRYYVPRTIPDQIQGMGESRGKVFLNHDMMTSRGCPFSCTCCCNGFLREFHQGSKLFRRRSVDHVVEEAKYARDELKVKFIAFWDDVFTVNREWLFDFARKYKQEVGLPFYCYLHAQCVEEELMDVLVEAGLRQANMGVESGSEKLRRDVLNRSEKNSDVLRAATICNPRIAVYYDLITDNPFETEDDLRETLDLFLQFPHPFHIIAFALVFFPNYPLTKRALSEGLITDRFVYSRENLAKNYFYPNRRGMSAEIRSLYSLVFATQHPEIDRDQIRAWSRDERVLARPEKLHEELYQTLVAAKPDFLHDW